ncbi:hypothetical protein ABID22_003042 [Pontibacter aydingkolensis]|uniref:SpoIIAA-like n=1 Tax=Pontibacter aydingkolensis TaxID=1911536 RepID=A0ABS7CY06_9BACT|nr:hypothetical protein [Pontibacter aydingkolensis]MBW7468697.1 hypothetical protein [Pontibacter aydingkolensis]
MNTTPYLNFPLQTVYQNEYVRADISEQQHFIYVKWAKHPSSDVFRSLFMELVNLTIEYKTSYWLSDARAIHYLEFSDQNWLIQYMAPYLGSTSVKKFARLSTKESIALMDVSRIYTSIEQLKNIQVTTQFEVFLSEEAALEWLFEEN